MQETIQTAARRVVRFIRGDDHAHGGLLSLDTIKAAEILDRQLSAELSFTRESKVVDVAEKDSIWYIRFDNSIEAVEFGANPPDLRVGDLVDIIIRKRA